MELQLRISGFHHLALMQHLLPPDGREAVAVALCGRHVSSDNTILTVHDVTLIPHNECYSRGQDILIWPTDRIAHYFERISKQDLAILKIHSHPGGYEQFSSTDDNSDKEFFDSAFGWAASNDVHASAVMLPGGKIFGRFFYEDLHHEPIDKIIVAGDDILIFQRDNNLKYKEFAKRTVQAFGEKTYSILQKMTIGVIGCSGTGSLVIEQLARLGVGQLILIDPDVIESKNLNRIINSTFEDSILEIPKVVVLSNSIEKMGLGTIVKTFQSNLYEDYEALQAIIKCDTVFGCMDSVDGRHLLNQLCSFYLIPYFDIGVKLEADGNGGIDKICASVHYLQPGKSSLITRGLYTIDDLRAASQFRKNPEEYEHLKQNAYIKNINVNRPAVISINMQIASHGVNEFLNRMHRFKGEHPKQYGISTIDITESYIVNICEDDLAHDEYLRKKAGRGDIKPFIEMPELSQ
jgi:ThiF family protein/JAB domain-containing protein similar to deubiquitination enzymes